MAPILIMFAAPMKSPEAVTGVLILQLSSFGTALQES